MEFVDTHCLYVAYHSSSSHIDEALWCFSWYEFFL